MDRQVVEDQQVARLHRHGRARLGRVLIHRQVVGAVVDVRDVAAPVAAGDDLDHAVHLRPDPFQRLPAERPRHQHVSLLVEPRLHIPTAGDCRSHRLRHLPLPPPA